MKSDLMVALFFAKLFLNLLLKPFVILSVVQWNEGSLSFISNKYSEKFVGRYLLQIVSNRGYSRFQPFFFIARYHN